MMRFTLMTCCLASGLMLLGGCGEQGTADPIPQPQSPSASPEEVAELRAEIEELRGELERVSDHENRLYRQGWRIERLESQVDWQVVQNRELQSRMAALWDQAKPEQITELPKRFTDQIDQYTWHEKRADKTAEFDMVLVPGDPGSGIEPFYMSTTEVTWGMFYNWAYSIDIDVNTAQKLQHVGLRPSPAYADSTQFRGMTDRKPAMSMSHLTAAAFCKWLSEQTGRNYRLPTHDEWLHALALGGGVPEDREQLLQTARLHENVEIYRPGEDAFDPFFDPDDIDWDDPFEREYYAMSSEVGSLAPNKLGIYDMLGNTAEWVDPSDGGEPRVVGGHFKLSAEELSASWRLFENQDLWNATYPQRPVSRFWYRDFYVTGLRLVCEPVNIPVDGED